MEKERNVFFRMVRVITQSHGKGGEYQPFIPDPHTDSKTRLKKSVMESFIIRTDESEVKKAKKYKAESIQIVWRKSINLIIEEGLFGAQRQTVTESPDIVIIADAYVFILETIDPVYIVC